MSIQRLTPSGAFLLVYGAKTPLQMAAGSLA